MLTLAALDRGKTWIIQTFRKDQCLLLVRNHWVGVLAGAGVVTLLFLTVAWVQSDQTDVAKRTVNLDSPFTSPPRTNREGGAVYTRWGKTICPEIENELVYVGYAAGSWYTHTGSGANILCLPNEPEWAEKDDTVNDRSLIHGVEYELLRNVFPFEATNAAAGKLHDHNMPCCVCRSTVRATTLMIPAKKTCPESWNLEYWGYLMGSHHTHQRQEYVCVDRAPEADEAGYRDENGALLYSVESKCGSLPCPPYVEGWELTCVVCTR